jgi:DNA-binding MarR family transcriptional regulator
MEKLNSIFFYHLEKAIKTYRQFAQAKLKTAGIDITIDQWLVLKAITDHPDISQTELAEMVFKDKASVTRIISLLVRDKYLKRETHSESRRRNQLTPSQKGKEVLKNIMPAVLKNRKAALKDISDKEIAVAEKVLKTIQKNCGRIREKSD